MNRAQTNGRPDERPHIESAVTIDATDGQIDALVYELYGLTDAEIRIAEAATGGSDG